MSANKHKRWFFAGGAFVIALSALLLVFIELSPPILGQSSPTPVSAENNKKKDAGVKEKDTARESAVPVTVAKLEMQSIQRTVDVVGSFEGCEELVVTPKVDGRVIRIHCDVGDIVRSGDVLLEIDRTDYQLAVEEVKKSIESELAKVGLTALPGADFDIMKLPTVVRAYNQYRNASSRFSRVDSLYKQKISTKEDWDQTYTDNEVAKSTVDQVKIDAQANIAKARQQAAILDTAQQRLLDTKVEVPAPSAAVAKLARSPQEVEYAVDKRMISEGEMATRANPKGVYRLVIDKLLKFKADVPEVYTSQIKIGQKVQIRSEAYQDKVFQGMVSRVSPTVDRLSRTFQVEILVPNLARELKPGGFAKASILTRVETQAKTVPVEALVTAVGTTKVFVVEDGKAHAVEVKTGVAERKWVEITGELDINSQVITSGQNQLAEGTKVKIR
ncbi:MAG: efflux RND transporter periplasmic adaptor subunit [Thermoguttaceae bacterium]|jgi:multidrug efflux pump subunit AcrA (membrane-fusion protein)